MDCSTKTLHELRFAMKENGIGRPSTRAAIIETLFKRHYIKRIRTSIAPTPTGVELIDLIREDLLKSAELTGIWEKKLRDIEHQKYDAQQFIDELKQQVTEIVNEVLSDSSNRRVAITTDEDLKKKRKPAPQPAAKPAPQSTAKPVPQPAANPASQPTIKEGDPCPLCGKGHIIKGKTAYGCSEWKSGCTWRQPF